MISAKTLLSLLLTTNPTWSDVDVDQAYCMAQNIWHEARAEDIEGQFAVAHTTLSRVDDSRYPDTVCDVVFDGVLDPDKPGSMMLHKCAFSWYCDTLSDDINLYHDSKTPNKLAIETYSAVVVISLMSMSGEIDNFCDGANFYYNPSIANPDWAKYYNEKCTIGNHVFLKREENSML